MQRAAGQHFQSGRRYRHEQSDKDVPCFAASTIKRKADHLVLIEEAIDNLMVKMRPSKSPWLTFMTAGGADKRKRIAVPSRKHTLQIAASNVKLSQTFRQLPNYPHHNNLNLPETSLFSSKDHRNGGQVSNQGRLL